MMFRKIVVCLSIVSVLSTVSGGAIASGFALLEQNASGMGNAYAGAAAVAEDASTIHYNPAGLSRLSGKQVVVAAHAIRPSVKFSGTGLAGTDMGGDAGSWAYVPNGYFAMEVNQDVRVGLGICVPFGLQTEYTSTWVGISANLIFMSISHHIDNAACEVIHAALQQFRANSACTGARTMAGCRPGAGACA